MSRTDLAGKELTAPDVIRRAFQEKHLGPDASPERVKEWVEWRFPAICFDTNYRAQIEAERRRFLAEQT
jgi:hypothetical protein